MILPDLCPNSQRVVPDKTVGEDLPVARVCFFRLGEIAAEIAFNQFFTGKAGHLLSGLVDIRDFSVSIDGDEGSRLASIRLLA